MNEVGSTTLGSRWTKAATATAKVRSDLPLVALDGVLVSAAYLLVFVLRFDGSVPLEYWAGFRTLMPLALVIHLVANARCGLYGQVWRHASITEARRVVSASGGAFGVICVLAALMGRDRIPMSVPLLGAVVVLLLVGGLRFQTRLFSLRRRGAQVDAPTRVVVVGAGAMGGKLIRDMHDHPEMGLRPVAAVDDALSLIGRSIGNVPVFGPLEMLPIVVERFGADQAVLAIGRADGELVRRVANLADQVGIILKVLPPTQELVSGKLSVRDVRDVQITDLLGRRQVHTDMHQVRAIIAGKRVLVTGAGGSIGSEILVQVAGLAPASLVALDCDETHLFDAAALVRGGCTQVLADVRDAGQVQRVFEQYRPEVVFHAAALKHVPILESFPSQAVVTNVVGTRNVARAAKAVGVNRFVLISTDKAVNPSSVMGATKQLAEQIVIAEAPPGRPWSAVRFGNVLGSRGSVVPTFMRQIAQGGPVTVTDPGMTRYFMSIPEAVELVLQSSALSEGNDLFMLDMGEPVRIMDLAERMIRLSGRQPGVDVPIIITGVRPGEKLTEELRTTEEATADTAHPAVIRVIANSVPHGVLTDGIAALLDTLGDDVRTRRTLGALVSGSVAVEQPTAKIERTPERASSLLRTDERAGAIYLSSPDMTDAERSALIGAFDSGWIAPVGPDLAGFEADMCGYLGLGEGCAAALSSGTAGLHLALRLAGVGPGDEVWTSTMTFVATANAVTYQGAVPVFIDVDPATWQMDPAVLAAGLEAAAGEGRLPAAVVTVDLYGQACDYDPILEVCGRYNIPVIEDAAEALGTTYKGRKAGTFGLASVMSFNGNKLITTGGGGMLVSEDADLVAKARYLATQARQPAIHYEHTEAGYNYRLSNLLAAVGRAQLGRIDALIARRRAIWGHYVKALGEIEGLSFMPLAEYGQVNHWLTCILLDPSVASPSAVCDALGAQQIEARPLWKPMHLQPVFRGHRLLTADDPTGKALGPAVADELFATGICLPSGSVLKDSDVERVVAPLRGTVGARCAVSPDPAMIP